MMLFIAIQKHGPKECPINEKGPRSLFDNTNKKVKVKGIYACPPAHTIYYVLEADDISELTNFFLPGMTRCKLEIKPVMEMK